MATFTVVGIISMGVIVGVLGMLCLELLFSDDY